VAVEQLDDAVEVAVGTHHTCARRSSGKVVCWGDAGLLGSLGHMAEVPELDDAAALATGEDVSCAARARGGVSCWGSASRGRLGNGTVSEYTTPQPVKGISGVTHLALADRVSCALDAQKRLRCWGWGPGWRSDEELEKRAFTPAPISWLGKVTSVTGREMGLCAVDKANAAFCAFINPFLKAGKVKPMDVKGIKRIWSDGHWGFGLLSSGQVFLWSDPDPLQTLDIDGLTGAVSVAETHRVVCAARRSGTVGCAGYGFDDGGGRVAVAATAAVEVSNIKDAVQVAGAGGTMCALRKTGEVSCFQTSRVRTPDDPKDKEEEQQKQKPRPIEADRLAGLGGDVTALVGGGGGEDGVFCAVKKDATLWCWGSNQYGQLGQGDFRRSDAPRRVPGLGDVAEIALGTGQVCAATKRGKVLCWGKNTVDQAGQPAPPSADSPVPVLLPGATL
jgi:hypothetical protein